MVDTIDNGSPFCNTTCQYEARRRAQIGRHHLRTGQFFNAVANDRVAFNLSMRTHTDQFRYVHETVFEDSFRDEARAFGHQVQQRELCLHIRRECRMWRSTHVNGFRTLPVHIEADPVFTDFDIRTRIAQFRQHRIQGIWLGVTADNLTARNGRGHQESTGFDTIWQYAIHTTTQTFNAFDGDTVCALPADLRPQRDQEVRGIHDLRLTGGVFDDGSAFCQRSSRHDGDRCAHAHFVHDNVRAFQTTIDGRFNVTLFQLDLRAEFFQAEDMQVNGTRADSASARQ